MLLGGVVVCSESLARIVAGPVSSWMARIGLTKSWISVDDPLHHLADLPWDLPIGLAFGLIIVVPLMLLSMPLQLPPRRMDRAIARGVKALAVGALPVLAIDTLVFVRNMVGYSQNEWLGMAAILGSSLSCLWIDAAIRRLRLWSIRRQRDRRGRCRLCGYDMRGNSANTDRICPECGHSCADTSVPG
jgi:hypothetical protein